MQEVQVIARAASNGKRRILLGVFGFEFDFWVAGKGWDSYDDYVWTISAPLSLTRGNYTFSVSFPDGSVNLCSVGIQELL